MGEKFKQRKGRKGMYRHQPKLKLLVGSWHLLKQIMGFGNPTEGGFATMKEVLSAVAELNRELLAKFGIEFAVSGHWWHELLVSSDLPDVGYSAKWNNPRAIDLAEWFDLRRGGKAPRVGRIIPPGFGLPGSDNGAFINPDPERRRLAHNMMVYSFKVSHDVIQGDMGEGYVIYWTGPDGIRWQRIVMGDDVLLGYDLNPELEEWKLVVNGVGGAVKEAREKGYTEDGGLLIEDKSAGDPSYLDVFTDTKLVTVGIKQINLIVGEEVAEWQGELCHSRGGRKKFVEAMRQAYRAGVFGGRIHFNAGGLGAVNFSRLLSKPGGTPMSKFPQYVDPDFLPGEGPEEWVEDQRKTLQYGAWWSALTGKPFEVEFDARFCRYLDTIDKLKGSAVWTINTFNEAAAQLAA